MIKLWSVYCFVASYAFPVASAFLLLWFWPLVLHLGEFGLHCFGSGHWSCTLGNLACTALVLATGLAPWGVWLALLCFGSGHWSCTLGSLACTALVLATGLAPWGVWLALLWFWPLVLHLGEFGLHCSANGGEIICILLRMNCGLVGRFCVGDSSLLAV